MRADWQKSPDDMEIRETDFITEDSSIDMLTVEPDVLKRGHGCRGRTTADSSSKGRQIP
jgi:hypothetical protein